MKTPGLAGLGGVVWLAVVGCAGQTPAPAPMPPPSAPAPGPPAGEAARAQPLDSDGDGIPDDRDACPNAAETVNGCKDDDGCPDAVMSVRPDGWYQIRDKIYFDAGPKVRSRVPPRASPLLDVLGETLKRIPHWGVVEVQGHAAANEPHAAELAEARAATVVAQLVARGVARDHLEPRGYGASQPACSEPDEDCFSRSRRVEFLFLEPAVPPPADPLPPHDCYRFLTFDPR